MSEKDKITMTTETSNLSENTHQADTSIDEHLMLQVAQGSESAFRMIVEKWKNPLVNFIYNSTRDFHLSEDIAITTFQKLYKARETYQPSAKFSTYLFKIARNEIISEFRKTQTRPNATSDLLEIDIPDSDEQQMHTKEIGEVFENAMKNLPEKQRTAISLLVQEDLPYAEIADIMGESVGAVKTMINRARAYLREAMKDFA